jgi:TPR repeat protein
LALPFGGCATESAGLAAYRRGDYGAAMNEFQRNKTPGSDFALGVMYCKGEGGEQDTAKGASHFRRAADGGHAEALYNLGLLYLKGSGVPRDLREAARCFRLSAAKGFAKAQYNLGLMYARGDGVERDRRKALHWLAHSARQGNPKAMKQIRVLLAGKQAP